MVPFVIEISSCTGQHNNMGALVVSWYVVHVHRYVR